MNHVHRKAMVPYSSCQMYQLVNAIEDYPQFLPWCKSARILSKTEHVIQATLVLAKGGIHKAFTTRNILTPDQRINIELVDGPFKHLRGCWYFEAKEHGCEISVDLEFEFSSRLLAMLFGPVFTEVTTTLVNAFTKEAYKRYG